MNEQAILKNINDFDNKSLLIVDDDNPFRERLARAMEKKGFEVVQAESVQKGIESVKAKNPGFAVVDLRLGDGNGLEVVKQIQTTNSESRIIMLTGYGNIPTAVAAIKEGAIDYLAKASRCRRCRKSATRRSFIKKLLLQKIQCQQIELNGSIFIEYLSYVIEMYLKQPEG